MLVFTGAEDGSVDSKGVFAIAAAAASVVASEMTEPTPMAMDASLEVECTLWIYHWNAAMSFSFYFWLFVQLSHFLCHDCRGEAIQSIHDILDNVINITYCGNSDIF